PAGGVGGSCKPSTRLAAQTARVLAPCGSDRMRDGGSRDAVARRAATARPPKLDSHDPRINLGSRKALAPTCAQRFLPRVSSCRRRALRTSSLASPTFFCTLPTFFSRLPEISLLLLPVSLPATSLTLPFTCCLAPSVRFLSTAILRVLRASAS